MGNIETITASRFPRQGSHLGKRCLVCFHYERQHTVAGEIVRDDEEAPWRLIIRLDNGTYVLGEECQYTLDLPLGR